MQRLNIQHPDSREREQGLPNKQHVFWSNDLADINIVNLPHEHDALIADEDDCYATISHTLDAETITRLESKLDLPKESFLPAIFFAFIYHYTNELDLILQYAAGKEPILPLRINLTHDISFAKFAHMVAEKRKQTLEHALPLAEVHQFLSNEARLILESQTPTNVLVTFNHDITDQENLHLGGLQISLAQTIDQNYIVKIRHHKKILPESQILRSFIHIKNIFIAVANNPDLALCDIPLMNTEELNQYTDFNCRKALPKNMKLFHEIFHEAVKRHPDLPFLVFHPHNNQPIRCSYHQFNELTNKIAYYLRHVAKIKVGDRVAVSLPRSIELFAYCYAIIKSGGVLVTLDNFVDKNNNTRFEHLIDVAKPNFFITAEKTKSLFEEKKEPIILIDDPQFLTLLYECPADFFDPGITPHDPAYIMFTSGTTGPEKPVLISHEGFASLHYALAQEPIPDNAIFLATAPITFDASLFEPVAIIPHNGTAHIISTENQLSIEERTRIINQEQISCITELPGHLSLYPVDLPSVKYTISMGQAMRDNTVIARLKHNPDQAIFNAIGHTQTTIACAFHRYFIGDKPDDIGQPIAGTEMLILSRDTRKICPLDVDGELYIGGPGVALGYFDQPDNTAKDFKYLVYDATSQRYLESDASNKNARRYFASSDLCSYYINNQNELSIRCKGRKDRGIKICGVLIYLDHVENIISSSPDVKGVCVIPNKDHTALFAYVAMGRRMPDQQIRAALETHLKKSALHKIAYPFILPVRVIPKTKNGKTDVKTLVGWRKPEMPALKFGHTTLESLTEMWKQALNLDDDFNLDTTTSFENYGGSSTSLLRLRFHINQDLCKDNPINFGKYFCQEMTLQSLAEAIDNRDYINNLNYAENHCTLFQNSALNNVVNEIQTKSFK